MSRCHICGQEVPHHQGSCRVLSDLDMFERVYRRLNSENRVPVLQENLLRILRLNGREV